MKRARWSWLKDCRSAAKDLSTWLKRVDLKEIYQAMGLIQVAPRLLESPTRIPRLQRLLKCGEFYGGSGTAVSNCFGL